MCLLYACHPQAAGGEERQQAFGSGWVCRSALCVQVAVLMLVHMAGRLSVLHVWTCVCAYLEYVSCPGTNWPVNTEPRLSCANRAGSGGYPWVLNRYHIQLLPTVLFYNHCNEKLLQTSCEELSFVYKMYLTQVVFRKVSDTASAHFTYCQFAPLGQILPQVIL